MPNTAQWWYEDEEGRKIGWLWPEEFDAICTSIWGKYYPKLMAADIGVRRGTIDEWKHGRSPIPKLVAEYLSMRQSNAARGIGHSPLEAEWLPYTNGSNGRRKPDEPLVQRVSGMKLIAPSELRPREDLPTPEQRYRDRKVVDEYE